MKRICILIAVLLCVFATVGCEDSSQELEINDVVYPIDELSKPSHLIIEDAEKNEMADVTEISE